MAVSLFTRYLRSPRRCVLGSATWTFSLGASQAPRPKPTLAGGAPPPRPPLKSVAVAASASQIGTLKTSRLLSQPLGTRLLVGDGLGGLLSHLHRVDCQAAAITAFISHGGLGA